MTAAGQACDSTWAHGAFMHATVTQLPPPSKEHATCAWCQHSFATIVELLTHVELAHVGDAVAAAA